MRIANYRNLDQPHSLSVKQKLTIEARNQKARKLIKAREEQKLIRVPNEEQEETMADRLAGSITSEQAAKMRKELEQMRNEWERNIY